MIPPHPEGFGIYDILVQMDIITAAVVYWELNTIQGVSTSHSVILSCVETQCWQLLSNYVTLCMVLLFSWGIIEELDFACHAINRPLTYFHTAPLNIFSTLFNVNKLHAAVCSDHA